MHANLKEQLFKQKVRQSHRVIQEQSTLYSTFVEPFTDVLAALKLGAQDLLNASVLAWKTFWTLSPEKLDAARDDFVKRKGEIAQKWEPVLQRVEAGIATPDAAMLMLAMNPGAFLAANLADEAIRGSVNIAGVLSKSGLKLPLLGTALDSDVFDDIKNSIERGNTTANKPVKEKSLLQRLAGLFYIETNWLEGEILAEENQPEKPALTRKNIGKELETYFKQTGVSKEFEKTVEELIESTRSFLDKILEEEALPKIRFLRQAIETADYEQFIQILESNKSEEFPIDIDINVGDLKKEIENQSQEIIKDPDFLSRMEKDQPGFIDKSDEEKIKHAEKIIFVNQKKEFDKDAVAGIENIKTQVLEAIDEEYPDNQTLNTITATSEGIKYKKLFDDAKLLVQNS